MTRLGRCLHLSPPHRNAPKQAARRRPLGPSDATRGPCPKTGASGLSKRAQTAQPPRSARVAPSPCGKEGGTSKPLTRQPRKASRRHHRGNSAGLALPSCTHLPAQGAVGCFSCLKMAPPARSRRPLVLLEPSRDPYHQPTFPHSNGWQPGTPPDKILASPRASRERGSELAGVESEG